MKQPVLLAKEDLAAEPSSRAPMAMFEWSGEYVVGIGIIDEQHQQLIKLINDFYLSLKDEGAKGALFEGMLEYTRYHFGEEEQQMRLLGYPEYHEHRLQHQAFVTKAMDLQARFKRGELVTSLEATNYLRRWLSEHILRVDKRFGGFVIRQKYS